MGPQQERGWVYKLVELDLEIELAYDFRRGVRAKGSIVEAIGRNPLFPSLIVIDRRVKQVQTIHRSRRQHTYRVNGLGRVDLAHKKGRLVQILIKEPERPPPPRFLLNGRPIPLKGEGKAFLTQTDAQNWVVAGKKARFLLQLLEQDVP